ncbi:TetR/AcrR family transcriptional regulator [Occultella gossypii]|uniref:WHG domain-containing protein n=1 Tax=Occultella gossypii TaxID=2800820 RepID=A0ABS7S3N1_9MICO|nr:TetR-like C-terminal domain-containing protein [Occultella gossypii]MBZ2194959.1 WHG domain-containing protein [Occultella gossypii]
MARVTYHHGNLREALVDAGLELTRSGGAGAMVLRDATRQVGVSPNAAYRHFADRESLLGAVAVAIQERMSDRMESYVAPAPAGQSGARARLTAVGLGYIDFAIAEPGWFEVAFAGTRQHSDTATPAPLARLLEALDALVASGELDRAARPGAEWPCWSAVHGFALLALTGPLRDLPAEAVRAAARRTVEAIITGLLG